MGSESIAAEWAIVLVKSNYLIEKIETKQFQLVKARL